MGEVGGERWRESALASIHWPASASRLTFTGLRLPSQLDQRGWPYSEENEILNYAVADEQLTSSWRQSMQEAIENGEARKHNMVCEHS